MCIYINANVNKTTVIKILGNSKSLYTAWETAILSEKVYGQGGSSLSSDSIRRWTCLLTNSQINICSAFTFIHRDVQSGEKLEPPDLQAPMVNQARGHRLFLVLILQVSFSLHVVKKFSTFFVLFLMILLFKNGLTA